MTAGAEFQPRIGDQRIQERVEWGVRWFGEGRPIQWFDSEAQARGHLAAAGFGQLFSRVVETHPARAEA